MYITIKIIDIIIDSIKSTDVINYIIMYITIIIIDIIIDSTFSIYVIIDMY